MHIQIQDLNVVLIEPSQTQQKLITKQFNEQGVKFIKYFAEANTALEAIKREPPDLVVSALYLPDGSGTELVKTLREDEKLHDIVFMLISSETRMQALDPVRQSGAVAILPKPFSSDQLRMALNSTLDLIDPHELQLEDKLVDDLEVLVVDDSTMARKHIRRVLESMGVQHITEAGDGVEAIPILNEHLFDLIITDYNMPQMDGDTLVNHIRTKSHQSSVPVLMVTSEENDIRLAAARQSGVSALADKPFEPGNIRALITQLLTEDG